MMPNKEHHPPVLFLIMRDDQLQQRRLGEADAMMAWIEAARELLARRARGGV